MQEQSKISNEASKERHNKKIFQNPDILKWVIVGLIGLVIVIAIFGAGMLVGGMKARFSYRWAESYHKNFAGPRGGFFENFARDFLARDFIDAHGTFGTIIKIDGDTLILKGRDDIEKVVVVSDKTVIQSGRQTISVKELKIDDQVVIIGSPNEQGQIEAKLIRLFPLNTPSMPPLPRR